MDTQEAYTPNTNRLLRLPEVQKKLRQCRSSVLKLEANGIIRPIRLGTGRVKLYSEAEIDALIIQLLAERG